MNSTSTESQPLRERLLPQTSIRFFLLLIGGCGLVMYTFRAAIVGDQFWAKILSLVIAMAIASLVASAVLFVLANLFSARTWRRSAAAPPAGIRQHSPVSSTAAAHRESPEHEPSAAGDR